MIEEGLRRAEDHTVQHLKHMVTAIERYGEDPAMRGLLLQLIDECGQLLAEYRQHLEREAGAAEKGPVAHPSWPEGDPDALLTFEDAAQRFGYLLGVEVSVKLVRTWLQWRELRSIRQGKANFIRLADVDAHALRLGAYVRAPGSPVATRFSRENGADAGAAAADTGPEWSGSVTPPAQGRGEPGLS
jgi:hypothetical protein